MQTESANVSKRSE